MRLLMITAFLCLALITLVSSRKCRNDEMVKRVKGEKATCQKCVCEGGGFHFNENYSRKVGKKGYLECLPCQKCPPGTFRKMEEDPKCKECKLNCGAINRHEHRECGGDSEGDCGTCLSGYSQTSHLANSFCKKDPLPSEPKTAFDPSTSTSPNKASSPAMPPLPTVLDPNTSSVLTNETSFPSMPPLATRNRSEIPDTPKPSEYTRSVSESVLPNSSTQPKSDSSSSAAHSDPLKLYQFLPVLVVGGFFILIFTAWGCWGTKRRCSTPRHRERNILYSATQPTPGQDMSSKTALLGGTNVSLANPDLEVDGPKFGPRGEQPLALGDFSSFSDIEELLSSLPTDWNAIVLNGANDYITLATKSLGTSGVSEIFTYLNIQKAVYEPEYEKWANDKHSYSDYLLAVLKTWQQSNGESATLGKLVTALIQAGNQDVAEKLVQMYKEKSKENCIK